MSARDPDETHRAATPVELFLDLTFAAAISEAASGLHQGMVDGHAGGGDSRFRARVLRDLVDMDELHVVLVGVQH